MIKKLLCKTTLLLFFLTSNIIAFEFGIHTKGIDLGFLDHSHFKLLTSCEGYYTLGGLSSVRGCITSRWFKFERSVFTLNCMSGVYLQYNRFKNEHYTYSDYEMLAFGLKILDLEPSVKFNDRVSLFIRCNLLNFNILPRKWVSAGMYELRNDGSRTLVNSSAIGIRIKCFKKSVDSGESK